MSQSAPIDLSDVSVLCVDDDPVIRSVVRFALQRHGCQDVVLANGGAEALDLCAGRTFNLLICDCQMSPMTGLDLLRTLAETGLGEGWPVIMLSAETDPATIEDAHALGVSAWVGKPVSGQELIDQIMALLHRRGQITRSRQDPEVREVIERHHARLMAGLRAADASVLGLTSRPREATALAQTLRRALDDIIEHGNALGYELITMLAARAIELVAAMTRNPVAAMRGHTTVAGVLGTMVTAMKRVAQNRMEGDGGVAGLKLLVMIDGSIASALAGLR